MPGNEHNIFSHAGEIGSDAGSLSATERHDTPNLVLRTHSENGDFLGAVTCLAEQVTVLVATEEEMSKALRNALLGVGNAERVGMRLGERVLQASEIYVSGRADFVWRSDSVAKALAAAGYSENALKAIAERLGLKAKLEVAPTDLQKSELRGLTIACAFRSRSRILLFDKPFAELEPKAANFLAEFMSEGAKLGRRIVIVTGVDKAPASWKDSPLVSIQGGELEFSRRISLTQKDDAGMGEQIRSLRREPSQIRKRPTFVTRPQVITFGQQNSQEAVKAEAIANPHVLSEQPSLHVASESEQGYRRSESGKLTRVTGAVRMRHSAVYLLYRRIRRAVLRILSSESAENSASLERKVRWLQRGKELKLFLLIVLILLAAMILFYRGIASF